MCFFLGGGGGGWGLVCHFKKWVNPSIGRTSVFPDMHIQQSTLSSLYMYHITSILAIFSYFRIIEFIMGGKNRKCEKCMFSHCLQDNSISNSCIRRT